MAPHAFALVGFGHNRAGQALCEGGALLLEAEHLQVACSATSTIMVVDQTRVYGWGDPVYGELGPAKEGGASSQDSAPPIIRVVQIPMPFQARASLIACGPHHVLIAVEGPTGGVWGWGTFRFLSAHCQTNVGIMTCQHCAPRFESIGTAAGPGRMRGRGLYKLPGGRGRNRLGHLSH
jgi:alpha-tubulin suppressor-like RCC1 family protein